jgi:hypothetical protein
MVMTIVCRLKKGVILGRILAVVAHQVYFVPDNEGPGRHFETVFGSGMHCLPFRNLM